VSPSEPTPRDVPEGVVRLLRGVVFALTATLAGLSLWVIVARFRYPIDGEFMVGAVRDGVGRLRDGKPLYAAPNAEFIAFVYTPIYYWMAALVARVTSTFVASKLVSIAASLVAGWGIYRISLAVGATRFWSRMALVLYLATYSLTIQFYDLERVDAFSAAMVVTGVAILFSRESDLGAAASGVLLALAFYAKQPGLVAFVAVVVALAMAGERRRAAIVGGAGVAAFAAMFLYLEATTGPWFRYYCVTLPRTHGVKAELISQFFILDMPKAFFISAGSIAVLLPLAGKLVKERKVPEGTPWRDVVFTAVVAAGMFGAFFMRAHAGGWPNVLVAWLPVGCAACAVAATRAEAAARAAGVERLVASLLLGGVALQLLAAMFDPNELAPNASDMREHDQLVGLVRRFEEQGPVLVTTTGEITKTPSVHGAALYDIVRSNHHAPPDLLKNLEDRRYSAIVVGEPGEFICNTKTCDELVSAFARNYFIAVRRHERGRSGMTGFDVQPRWVLRPRKRPLPEMPMRDIFMRQHVERGLAAMKSAKVPASVEVEPAEDIEELAEREIATATARAAD